MGLEKNDLGSAIGDSYPVTGHILDRKVVVDESAGIVVGELSDITPVKAEYAAEKSQLNNEQKVYFNKSIQSRFAGSLYDSRQAYDEDNDRITLRRIKAAEIVAGLCNSESGGITREDLKRNLNVSLGQNPVLLGDGNRRYLGDDDKNIIREFFLQQFDLALERGGVISR